MTLRNLLFVVIDVAFNAAARGHAAGRRLRLRPGLGLARPDHGRGPVRRGAERSARPARRRGRPAAGRCGLDEPAARHRRGAGRPRSPAPSSPTGRELVGKDLRFAYREGHDVLHGVDLRLRTGERLAIVGPSGSGKSTLGRLLSGINGPRTGSVTVGGVELIDLPLEMLRTEVALVTQEHHVFKGSVRDNIMLAREGSSDERCGPRCAPSMRSSGSSGCPRASTPARLGQAGADARPGPAGRPGAADHRRPAHHRPRRGDLAHRPRTARTLEGSMNALLDGPHGRGDRPPAPHRPRRRPDRRGHRRPRSSSSAATTSSSAARRRVRRTLAGLDLLSSSSGRVVTGPALAGVGRLRSRGHSSEAAVSSSGPVVTRRSAVAAWGR